MEQTNATVRVDAARLNFPLAPLHARAGHSFRVLLAGVPADVEGVYVRLFRPDGAYYDVRANEHASGAWTAYAVGTCFPAAGQSSYEVHAEDARGNPTALGAGTLDVAPFSASSSPSEPGAPVRVCEIPTKDGALVQIRMVLDDAGEWVYEAVLPEDGSGKEAGR